MSVATALPPELVEAYRRTDYHVDWPDGLGAPLRVGQRCEKLAGAHGEGWAYITACNPLGSACSDDDNCELHEELQREVAFRVLKSLSGRGQGTDGDWPAEESLLIFGIGRAEAEELGRQFRQNAIVWVDPDNLTHLVLLK